MNSGRNISRKEFFKRLTWLIALPYLFLTGLTFHRHSQLNRKRIINVGSQLGEGITFHDNIIIVKQRDEVLFLSSKCSHLGCKINSLNNNELVCPCHGSRFSKEGRVIKGPAKTSLKQLEFDIDLQTNDYLIKI